MAINPNLFAGLGPFAGLTQAATESLARGVGGLFGIKDPEMEAQRAIAMAAQNPNNPTTLSNAANILAQAGKIDQAMALAGQARQIQQQERQFGLQERQAILAEERAKAEAEDRAKRLEISGKELELRLKELENRKDLTTAQVNEINARIKALDKGDYTIREQKGGIDGNTTVAFVAINDKPPFNTIVIPVTPGGGGGAGGGAGGGKGGEVAKKDNRPKPGLDTFFTGGTGGVAP